jgi:hypothetical protein
MPDTGPRAVSAEGETLMWQTVCACFLACLLAGAEPQQPSSKHGPIKLAWKFKEKDRFSLDSLFHQVELRRSGVQVHKDVISVQVMSSFTVNKVNDDDKSVVLEQKIEDARFRLVEGTDRVNAVLHADLFAKLVGATFRITLTEDGKVQKFEGYDELIRRIQQASPQDVERFKAMVSEESLKNATEEGFGCFPPGEVKNGETWKRPATIPVPPAGTLKGELVFTLRGVTKGKAKITSKGEKFAHLPGDYLVGVKCDFALDAREGTLHFDVEKGRLVSAETTVRYKGKVTTTATEGNLAATLLDVEMQQNVKITVRDHTPRK